MTNTLTERAFDTLTVDSPAEYVLNITLNRPDRRNAFNTRMAEELISVWDWLKRTDGSDYRCVVLTGAGDKAFCSGADLKERRGMDRDAWTQQHALFEKMSYGLMECSIPVIGAVEGAAYAGGFELMLGCSFVYASENARFALTEVTLGLIPGIGGTQLLPRATGRARALEILLTGMPFGAAEALEWGVVNRLCAPGTTKAEALESAKRIAANAPLSVRQALRAARNANDTDLTHGLAFELECYNTLVDTEDRQEGINAFNEKRPPRFVGR